jgi:hypothetical protein
MLCCSGECATGGPELLSNFHGAGWLDLVFVIVAVTAHAAHLVAIVRLLAGFVDLFLGGVLGHVFCKERR